MKIEIMNNGLSLTYGSDNYFVPYNAITTIEPICVYLDNKNYDWLARKYFGQFIYKKCAFNIKTYHKTFTIYIDEDIKSYPRNENKNINASFWKLLICGEEGLSTKAKQWKNDDNMKQEINHLNDLRNKIINAINKVN